MGRATKSSRSPRIMLDAKKFLIKRAQSLEFTDKPQMKLMETQLLDTNLAGNGKFFRTLVRKTLATVVVIKLSKECQHS